MSATLHSEAIVIDGHADTFGFVADGSRDFLRRSEVGHIDLPRMREGGIDLQLMAIFTPKSRVGDEALAFALDMTAAVHRTLREGAGAFCLIREADDLACLGQTPAIMLHLEGVTPLAGQLERLELLEALGFRSVGLTHNHANEAAGGCGCADEDDRLTPFGAALVEALLARGFLLDVAHLGQRSLEAVLELGGGPLVSTHTGMGALRPRKRNLTDAQVQAIAGTGGLVAIDFVPQHLLSEAGATREDVFRHIDHAVSLVGAAHVGIGSDFDGYETPLGGMPDATAYPWLTERMLQAGYADDAVRQIIGGNFLRILREQLSRRAAS